MNEVVEKGDLPEVTRHTVEVRKNMRAPVIEDSNNDTKDYWPLDGVYHPKSAASYDHAFQNLIPEEAQGDLNSWLELRKQDAKTNNVLDLFGSGFFVHNYNVVDSVVGVRLGEAPRKLKEKAGVTLSLVEDDKISQEELDIFFNVQKTEEFLKVDAEKRSTVEGDLYSPATFNKLSKHMRERSIQSFDFITCKPAGPFTAPSPKDIAKGIGSNSETKMVYISMLNKAYRLLSSEEGVMLFTLPKEIFSDSEIEEWLANINANSNVAVKYDDVSKAVSLIKSSGAPGSLTEILSTNGTS